MQPNSYIKDLETSFGLNPAENSTTRIFNVLEIVVADIVAGDELDVPKKLVEMFDKTARTATRVWGPSEKFQLVRQTMNKFFSHIGSGSNVETFRLNDKILKLNCAWGGAANDASCEWVKACISINGNKFVPKFYAMHQIGNIWCALGERLESNDLFECPEEHALTEIVSIGKKSSYDTYEDFVVENMGDPIMAFLAMGREETIQMAQILADVKKQTRSEDDLACFNMMCRGKIPVINDPLSGGSKQYKQAYLYEWVDR